MEDADVDAALIGAGFALIAERGWHRFSVAAAARAAGIPLDRARARCATRGAFLCRFGAMADRAALEGAAPKEGGGEGPVKDRLFDLLMRRIDVLQAHRAGVIALLKALPFDPVSAVLLAEAGQVSMGWMLEAAGSPAAGPRGRLRRKGLLGVWLWTVRAWMRDESEDLSATMAALDDALTRAGRFASMGRRERGEAAAAEEVSEG